MKIAVGIALLFLSSATAFGQTDFKLPRDNDKPFLVLDYVGGLRIKPPKGFVRKPQLQVFPDGRVVRSQNTPKVPGSEFRLSKKQLNEFLKQVITESRVYDISGDDIKAQVAAAGGRVLLADGSTLKLSINVGDREHKLSVYALTFLARDYPDIEPIANLVKIEKLCKRLMGVADLGSFQKLDKALAVANKTLKEEGHGAMSTIDLSYVTKRDGKTSVVFVKVMGKGKQRENVRVKVAVVPDGEMTAKTGSYPYRGK